MASVMSACGVLCSDCPAYQGNLKGVAHQERTAAAWRRIYGLNELSANISCSGCSGPESELFHTCRDCDARRCCHAKGFQTCAECSMEACSELEKAQSLWDGVPHLVSTFSREDFILYAQPYCGHRRRLAEARRVTRSGVADSPPGH